jgi:signal transduction histidine kinase
MYEILKHILPCQIIVVISLLTISFQVYKVLQLKEFKYISLAWASNLAYLFSSYAFEKFPACGFTGNILSILLDCFSTFCFLKAAVFLLDEGERYYWVKRIPNSIIISILLTFGAIKILYPLIIQSSIPPYIAIGSIPSALIDGFILYLLSFYFKKLCEQYALHNKLYYGILIYACIQSIAIARPDAYLHISTYNIPFEKIGMLFGLLLKVWILFYLSELFLLIAKTITDKKYISTKLDQIILNTFHEISHPLSAIIRYINVILPDEKNEIPSKNEIIKHVRLIESSYYHMAAIIAASLKENEDQLTEELKRGFENVIPRDSVIQAISVNTLIEIAVFHTKAISSERIEFAYDFGGNCNIFCNPTLMVELFENLFINAREAFPGNTGIIKIRTRLEKLPEDKMQDLDYDRIVNISVEDNGLGIEKSIQSRIYDEGFSTRIKAIRGRGLYLVKEILNKMGATIDCISPVNENALDKRVGTKFNISIPVTDNF